MPKMSRRWYQPQGRALFLNCVACGSLLPYYATLGLPEAGLFVHPCDECHRPLKVVIERVPLGHYTEESEICSPDRSAIAVMMHSDKTELVYAMKPSSRVSTPTLQALDGQVTQLRELETYAKERRAALLREFGQGDRIVAEFDRLIARQRRWIMKQSGASDESDE